MSSSSEKPRLPAEDRPEVYQPTVATLAADCAEYAGNDIEFNEFKRVLTSIDTSWKTIDGISWHVGFNAMHNYEDGSYSGDAYLLELTVGSETDRLSSELKNAQDKLGYSLPEDDNVRWVMITYVANYLVSQYVTLGWSSHRDYKILHNQDGIVGPGCQLNPAYVEFTERAKQDEQDENDDQDEQDEGYDTLEIPPKYLLIIRKIIDEHDPPEVSPEIEVGSSRASNDDELIAGLDVDLQLRNAREILSIVQNGKANGFDLYTILPPEAMEKIDQF